MDDHDCYREQVSVFETLLGRVARVLDRFGKHMAYGVPGDFSIYDGYWGYPQVKVSIMDLKMLRPPVVKALQELLSSFPGWEIIVAVCLRGTGEAWPEMGLIVRPHEIVDGLQRQYFPREFQDIAYEGSRRGTIGD